MKRKMITWSVVGSIPAGIGALSFDFKKTELREVAQTTTHHLLVATSLLLIVLLVFGDLSFHIIKTSGRDGSSRTSFVLSLGQRWRRNASAATQLSNAEPDAVTSADSPTTRPFLPTLDTRLTQPTRPEASDVLGPQRGIPPYWSGYRAAYAEIHTEAQAAADIALARSINDPNQLLLPEAGSWRLRDPDHRDEWRHAAGV